MIRWLPLPILIASCVVVYDYHINPTGWYDLALFFLPLTLILTIVLTRHLPNATEPSIESVAWQKFTRPQVILTSIGLLCFIVLAQAQGKTPGLLQFVFGMHHAHQFFLFMLGIICITWGMMGGIPIRHSWRSFRFWASETDAKWLFLIVGIGLFVRVIALDSAIHYYVDETNFADAVTRLRNQPHTQIMNNIGPVANFTWVFPYLQYYYTELFGASLGTLRMVSVIIGTLTILAVYLLGRWGFNRRVGLLGAFLLAIDLPHIHYSRLALNNIVDPLLGVLTIALLWRGLQTQSRRMVALGGVCLGLTSYFYEGGRLLFPALIIAWLLIYSLMNNFRVFKRGIAIFVASAVLITSGYYLSLGMWGFQNVAPRLLQQRMAEDYWEEFFTSSDTFNQLLRYVDERLNPPYLHIMSQPDGSGFYYSREVGLVLPQMLPFLLIGLGVACYHWRRIGLILPLWVLLTVLGNSLLDWNDWTPRFVVLFPVLVLLMALGLDVIYRALIAFWTDSEKHKKWIRQSGVVLFFIMGIMQFGYYFGVMMPDYNVAIRIETDDQDAGYRAQLLSSETEIYIIPIDNKYHLDVGIVQNFEQQQNTLEIIPIDEFDFTIVDADASYPYAFFILPDDTESLNQLRQLFGNRLMGPEWSPYNVPRSRQFVLYQVEGQ